MKNKNESTTPAVRSQYTAPFKEQALERAERDGIPRVAQDLGLSESMGYSWRAKRRQTGQSCEDQTLQHAEIARLKRENARLEEEVACLNKAAAYLCPLGTSRNSPSEVMLKAHENQFPMAMLCRMASVSRSGSPLETPTAFR
jgi:transposase-like protein